MTLNRFVLLLLVAWSVGVVQADTVWLTAGGGNELEARDVRVTRVENEKIYFQTPGGREAERDLSQVSRLGLDDEPALSNAEVAYFQHNWTAATDAYRQTIDSTRRIWLKAWIAPRLIESADNAKRFDSVVAGYVALAMADPARAAKFNPNIPEEDRAPLNAAAIEVESVLSGQQVSGATSQALLGFLLDINRARRDQPAVERTLDRMLKSGDDAAARAVLRRKLNSLSAAIEGRKFETAIADIQANKQLFVDARDQAEALYLMAEARSGLAGERNDQQLLKDAAVDYMRVVAQFKDSPGKPFVTASLLKVAGIEERLNDLPAARKLYQQVVTEFAQTPAAGAAQAALLRLSGNRP